MFMKRYFYILLTVVSALAWSCREEIDDTPDYKDAGMLEVSFVYEETTAESIVLTPAFQTVEVDALLNIEGIKWKVVSNRPWCIVDDEIIHEGSGKFEITVVANDGYEDRQPATVSLCAGEYKAELSVSQSGNVFIVEQVLGLAMQKSGSTEVTVKVAKGTEWQPKPDSEWITVTSEEVSTSGDETEYKMTVNWESNTSVSRLGTVGLYRASDEHPAVKYALWQFGAGQEYDFEADGNIRLASKPSAEMPLEIRTPSQHIESLNCPDWVQLEKVENDDNTTSWFLFFDPNPADYNGYRETLLTYTTLNDTGEKTLPAIYQESYHVGGLMTAKGFALFAEKFNAGGADAVADWVKDGVVNVLSMVDMSQSEDVWVPIGTEERPFNLKFNGNGKTISGFSASAPLFGVCNGAEISDLIIDDQSKISVAKDFNADVYVAALAGKIINTNITGCKSQADVTFSGRANSSSSKIYLSSLVAYAGEGAVISSSHSEGTLTVAEERQSVDGEVYIGGLASYLEGIVDGCTSTGKISDKSVAKLHYVGGLVGMLNSDMELNFTSEKPEDSKPVISCDIDINGLQKDGALYVGGIIGAAKKSLTLTSPQWNGTISLDMSAGATSTNEVCIGGVLGFAEAAQTILGEAATSGSISLNVTRNQTVWNVSTAIGGVVGCACAGCAMSGAVNNVSIGWNNYSGASRDEAVSIGGVVGRVNKGATVISGCTNNGQVYNYHQHPSKWNSGKLLCSRTGGIIGTYGFVRKASSRSDMDFTAFTESDAITITDCHTTRDVKVLTGRGLAGGIAGYLYNATVKDCSYTGNSSKTDSYWNCNVGGIAGAVEKTLISDCTVTASISGGAQGDCELRLGGIAAYLYSGSSISGCRYYGFISQAAGKNVTSYLGGIVGEAQMDCSVTGCWYGGSIQNKPDDVWVTIDITRDNYADYIIGNQADIAKDDCYYWTGE